MLKRQYLAPLALLAVFGIPFAASWFLVWKPEWLPQGRSNHGELISPPLATPLTGAWTLLISRAGPCDEECERLQNVVHIVRRALGADGRHVVGPAQCAADAPCDDVVALLGDAPALVIVDPMGNAMMRYGSDVTPRDLLKDVQRLVKVSRNWRFDADQ